MQSTALHRTRCTQHHQLLLRTQVPSLIPSVSECATTTNCNDVSIANVATHVFDFLLHREPSSSHSHSHASNVRRPIILVNSHKNSTIALSHLIESMQRCGSRPQRQPTDVVSPTSTLFSHFRVLVVRGGFYELPSHSPYRFVHNAEFPDNVAILECNHNSIDFTSFIAVRDLHHAIEKEGARLEDVLAHLVYFYMHDTCAVGYHFFENMVRVMHEQMPCARNTLRIRKTLDRCMNMGFYRHSWIVAPAVAQFLETKKNTDPAREMEFKSVNWAEGKLFELDDTSAVIDNYDNEQFIGPLDYYGTGVMRRVEYYSNLDMFKIKANWGQGKWTLNN